MDTKNMFSVEAARREFDEAASASVGCGKNCGCPSSAFERADLCAVHGRLADAFATLERVGAA